MKCCFWLAIVYAAILYGIGPLGSPAFFGITRSAPASQKHDVAADVTAMHGVVEAAARSAAGLCANHAAECLTQAAHLTALFKASAADTTDDADARQSVIGRAKQAPTPVPDPRRLVRALRLTPRS